MKKLLIKLFAPFVRPTVQEEIEKFTSQKEETVSNKQQFAQSLEFHRIVKEMCEDAVQKARKDRQEPSQKKLF